MTALCAPVLAAALLAQPAGAQEAELRVTYDAPHLYIVGEPFLVDVRAAASGERDSKLDARLMSPAGFTANGKSLGDRDSKTDLTILPGQSVETTIDLSPLIAERFEDDHGDFRLSFVGTKEDPIEVTWLDRAERGINFMEMPIEQVGEYQVVLFTSAGPVHVELWEDVAPNHVRNFLDLCYTGHYDGSGFHRVVPGFMIQGGKGKENRAAPRTLDAEFSTRRHVRGVLSAARMGNDLNSHTCEFFLMHQAAPSLDGKYSAFGAVLDGLETVDAIVKSVEVHYALVNKLQRITPINPQDPRIAAAMNAPNPPQEIIKAVVVKAPKNN